MREFVAAFMADLLIAGGAREWIIQKGYDYALALQTDQLKVGASISSDMMATAAHLVRQALPDAIRMRENAR